MGVQRGTMDSEFDLLSCYSSWFRSYRKKSKAGKRGDDARCRSGRGGEDQGTPRYVESSKDILHKGEKVSNAGIRAGT